MTKPIKYKNTGLEWCPQIPEHWEVRKISQGFETIGSGTTPSAGNILYYENGIYNWLQTGDLTNNVINETSKKITQEALDNYSTLRFYKKESLVIAMYGATIGKVGILNIETTTNQACCVLSNSSIWIIKYIYYWFISNKRHIVTLSYGGGQPNISQQTIRDLRLPLPPLMEQQKIADYLDRKTSLIDSIISKKEKQIELYKEERTAIINHAVTKGLNPNVEMKDSGIEWLGSIPKHWEVKRLKYLTSVFGRIGFRGYQKSDMVEEGQGAITLSPSNMKELGMEYFKCAYLSWDKYEESPEIKIANNDIIFVKTGSSFGKVNIVKDLPQEATINPQLLVFKNILIDYKYFYLLLLSETIKNQIKTSVIGGTIPTISQEKILNYYTALSPNKEEQQEIVTYLDNETNRIDTLISKTSKQIELLKEYKEALINEVVTGQRIIH